MAMFKPPLARKVPHVIALFWLIKILTTALGESTSDYLVHVLNPYLAVGLGAAAFAAAIAAQFMARRYQPEIYWTAVAMVAVFGTMAADVLHVGFGVPYAASTVVFAVALAAVFVLWYASEKTLSIHSITTTKRELFYWATVLATFALGTAAGDLFAYTLQLGFLTAGIVFIMAIAAPAAAYRFARLNEVVAFWTAYVLTRPVGASFADWFGKAKDYGGVGFGDSTVSAVLAGAIIILVAYLQVTRADVERSR